MRVLMTADAVGGVWTYAVELARGLVASGVDVTLACLGPPPDGAQRAMLREESGVAGAGLRGCGSVRLLEYPGRLEWMDEPWQDVDAAGRWLLQIAAEVQAELVHLNGFAHADLPWSAPVVVVGHSCVVSWWEAVHGCRPPASWDTYVQRVRRGIQAATLVVAPTRDMLASLRRQYGPIVNAQVISNGRSQADGGGRMAKWPIVFTAGRLWDQAKNIAAVTAVAEQLTWPVYVGGDGGMATHSTRAESLVYLGRLGPNDVATWMARASVFALPVRYEPFGLAALEAASAACALVLGDIPAQREVWGGAAVYVPPDDRHALTRALQRLIDDGVLRAEMAARAQARASDFTVHRMTEAYLDAYRALLPLAVV